MIGAVNFVVLPLSFLSSMLVPPSRCRAGSRRSPAGTRSTGRSSSAGRRCRRTSTGAWSPALRRAGRAGRRRRRPGRPFLRLVPALRLTWVLPAGSGVLGGAPLGLAAGPGGCSGGGAPRAPGRFRPPPRTWVLPAGSGVLGGAPLGLPAGPGGARAAEPPEHLGASGRPRVPGRFRPVRGCSAEPRWVPRPVPGVLGGRSPRGSFDLVGGPQVPSLAGARGVPPRSEQTSRHLRAYVQPEARRDHPRVARHRRRPTSCWAGWPPSAATLLRGKHKPQFAPHVDTGDFVVDRQRRARSRSPATSASEVRLPALRLPGRPAQAHRTASCSRRTPERVVELAVKGMLPHNTPRPAAAQEAQGLRRPRAPARRAAAQPVRDQPGRAVIHRDDIDSRRPELRATAVAVTAPVVGRRKEAIVRVRLRAGHRQVHAQRPHPRGVLPEQGAPAAHPRAVRHPREGRASSTSSPTCAAAASPARPARCGWPSPGR